MRLNAYRAPNRHPTYQRWVYRSIRMLLGAVFLATGFFKILDPSGFAVLIEAYGIIPEDAVMAAAFLLAVFEMLSGLGLILDMRYSLSLIAGLLCLFLAVLGYGMYLGLDIDCGCFGKMDPEQRAFGGMYPAFVRDLAMMGCVVFLYYWRFRHGYRARSLIRMRRGTLP